MINNFCQSLLEKGRQMLMKDNLIDEDKAKQEEAAQENLQQKIDRWRRDNNINIFPILTLWFYV